MTKWNPSYPDRVRRYGLILTNHAIQRMTERRISPKQVKEVIATGQPEYAYEGLIRYSYPRRLTHDHWLAWAKKRALDDLVILVAKNKGCVVTVYREADPDDLFTDLFPQHVRPPANPNYRGRKLH